MEVLRVPRRSSARPSSSSIGVAASTSHCVSHLSLGPSPHKLPGRPRRRVVLEGASVRDAAESEVAAGFVRKLGMD